jgi:protoporphyrinogen/coproporphyrinogen III oxidase
MTTIVVVGGGVTGLSAARLLAVDGFEVIVLEATSRWGGKLAPIMLDGVRLDAGAESILARRPEGLDLIADLGLAAKVVHPTQAQPRLLVGGRLHPMPPSLLGVPTDLDQLAGLVSPEGLRMAASEPELPAPALDHDVAIGQFVDERLGAEVTDRLLEPLLGAVYAGHARLLSFHAVAPELFQRVRAGGSLVRHAQQVAGQRQLGPVFAGLMGGVSTLVDGLVDDLVRRGVIMRSGMVVRALEQVGHRFRLILGAADDPRTILADGVLLSAPAPATGRLLSSLAASAGEFAQLPYASVAVITLVAQGVRTDASGVLVPPGELPTIKALTYSSAKWSWVAAQAPELGGPGAEIIRVSVGRHREATTLQLSDQALLERTFAEARTIPGWEAAALVQGTVSRWGGGLPQYPVGHRDLVARLRGDLAGMPGLAVAGAALDGVGIAACLGSARTAVRKLAADLGASTGAVLSSSKGSARNGSRGMIESEDQLEESGR